MKTGTTRTNKMKVTKSVSGLLYSFVSFDSWLHDLENFPGKGRGSLSTHFLLHLLSNNLQTANVLSACLSTELVQCMQPFDCTLYSHAKIVPTLTTAPTRRQGDALKSLVLRILRLVVGDLFQCVGKQRRLSLVYRWNSFQNQLARCRLQPGNGGCEVQMLYILISTVVRVIWVALQVDSTANIHWNQQMLAC